MKRLELAKDRQTALIVVDVQPDFYPTGPLPVPKGDQVVEPIAQLMTEFSIVVCTQDSHPEGHISFASTYGLKPFEKLSEENLDLASQRSSFTKTQLEVYLRKVHGKEQILWPDHCVIDTPGWQLDARLPLTQADLILRKGTRLDADSLSAFYENDGSPTGLAGYLRERGVRRVVPVGLAGDYCVFWSAEDAIREGFEVVFDEAFTRFVDFPAGSCQQSIETLRDMGARFVSLLQ